MLTNSSFPKKAELFLELNTILNTFEIHYIHVDHFKLGYFSSHNKYEGNNGARQCKKQV